MIRLSLSVLVALLFIGSAMAGPLPGWCPWDDPKPVPPVMTDTLDRSFSPAVLGVSGLLTAYRIFLSPLIATRCNFSPTCSRYALQAVRRTNALQGTVMAADRLLRDHHGLSGYYRYDWKTRHFIDPVEDHVMTIPVLSWLPF